MSSMRRAALLVGLLVAATALTGASEDLPLDQRRSSYDDMAPATRAMQDADTDNPGMLWVLDGEALWREKTGSAKRACADCHGDAKQSMAGVAARYPAFDARRGGPVTIEGRINSCRVENQNAQTLAYESRELLALTAYLALQSRGKPIAIDEKQLGQTIAAGREIFQQRQGQLNLSCAQCHDQHYGGSLAGNTIPQGHPNGYPLYRLEWQTLGSLQRRLRNCLTGMRAESHAYGSRDLTALETYLMWRARGMSMESPAVRP
jgi:sulfur-oxidizing protein SoxA